jgi:hypothetical protein
MKNKCKIISSSTVQDHRQHHFNFKGDVYGTAYIDSCIYHVSSFLNKDEMYQFIHLCSDNGISFDVLDDYYLELGYEINPNQLNDIPIFDINERNYVLKTHLSKDACFNMHINYLPLSLFKNKKEGDIVEFQYRASEVDVFTKYFIANINLKFHIELRQSEHIIYPEYETFDEHLKHVIELNSME